MELKHEYDGEHVRQASRAKSNVSQGVISQYVSITKPGIIFGNVVTLAGGFFLASRAHFNPLLFLFTFIGMALVIACGCVLNNIVDRDIDEMMERTQHRLLVKGVISPRAAGLYASILGVLGVVVLWLTTNKLTVLVALIGLFFYVVVYTLATKRTTLYGTTIGGIAGAVPPVVGYCAVSNRFDVGAIVLFLILFSWQMPHFYAISIYRMQDFKAAKIPVLPIKKDILCTKYSMLLYIVAFVVASVMPTIYGYTGWFYFVGALLLGLIWLGLCLKGFRTQDNHAWARKLFLYSILNITLLCVLMSTALI